MDIQKTVNVSSNLGDLFRVRKKLLILVIFQQIFVHISVKFLMYCAFYVQVMFAKCV